MNRKLVRIARLERKLKPRAITLPMLRDWAFACLHTADSSDPESPKTLWRSMYGFDYDESLLTPGVAEQVRRDIERAHRGAVQNYKP